MPEVFWAVTSSRDKNLCNTHPAGISAHLSSYVCFYFQSVFLVSGIIWNLCSEQNFWDEFKWASPAFYEQSLTKGKTKRQGPLFKASSKQGFAIKFLYFMYDFWEMSVPWSGNWAGIRNCSPMHPISQTKDCLSSIPELSRAVSNQTCSPCMWQSRSGEQSEMPLSEEKAHLVLM